MAARPRGVPVRCERPPVLRRRERSDQREHRGEAQEDNKKEEEAKKEEERRAEQTQQRSIAEAARVFAMSQMQSQIKGQSKKEYLQRRQAMASWAAAVERRPVTTAR